MALFDFILQLAMPQNCKEMQLAWPRYCAEAGDWLLPSMPINGLICRFTYGGVWSL